MKVTLTTSAGTDDLEGEVTVSATTSEPITRSEFFVDDVLAGSDASALYSYAWDTETVSNGEHQLRARVYYLRRQVAEQKLDVTVFNPFIPAVEEEMMEEGYPVLVE